MEKGEEKREIDGNCCWRVRLSMGDEQGNATRIQDFHFPFSIFQAGEDDAKYPKG